MEFDLLKVGFHRKNFEDFSTINGWEFRGESMLKIISRIRRILESKSSAIESRMAESCYGMQTFSYRRVAMVAMTIYSSIP